jgi:hypothetical protein
VRPLSTAILSVLLVLPISAAAEMQITAACRNDKSCPASGTVVLRDGSEELTITITDGVARFSGDAARPWDMELRAPGFWSPLQRLASSLDVWRTTQVRGKFVVEKGASVKDGDALPEKFTVVLESPFAARGTKIARDTKVECPLAADGSWDCPLPAALLDLTIRAKGFIPHYLWDTKLSTAAPTKVGTLTLRRGGSFVAWLDRDTVAALQKPATARLVRMAAASGPEATRRLLAPVAEATFNKRGAVQLAPVPPGTYALEISAPGFATSRTERIEILARSESSFRQPIHLDPPLDLRFTLTPPRDADGRSWELSVGRRNAMNAWSQSIDSPEIEPGVFAVKEQAPGEYSVLVLDKNDNEVDYRTVTIQGAADADQRIELSLVGISGVVTLGDEPVPAKLLFGGTSGAQKIRSAADAEGRFNVTLPRTGRWLVEATGDDVMSVLNVDVVAGKQLAIALPDTEISGWVTGPTGDRVPAAEVRLITNEGTISRRAKADGSFRFRGGFAGSLTARDLNTGEHTPTPVSITLDALGHAENIELQLQSRRTLSGVITSGGEKVAGAFIMAMATDGTASMYENTSSDVDGTFRVTFPVKTSRLSITVAAAGRTFEAFAVPVQDTPVQLDLAPEGGTLRLQLAGGGGGRLIVQYQGAEVPLQVIAMWLRANQRPLGAEMIVPYAAPGQWRLCSGAVTPSTCREGLLSRGGTLDLDIGALAP